MTQGGVSISIKNGTQRLVYKVNSKKLKDANWNLQLPFDLAMNNGEVVALADSTVLRWIDELNGISDADAQAGIINQQIRHILKQKDVSSATKLRIRDLMRKRNLILFKQDYVCVVMDSIKDYRKMCERGFSINGIPYTRLLATTGGVKNRTVVFISERLYPEIRRRLDNGRDMNKEIVPAKFGAYEALACSASTPVSDPKGILVVHDCYTYFVEDIITIDDSCDGEPELKYVDGYKVHKDCSDGFGTMTPERAELWSKELGLNYVMSGCNTRYAWEKGMLVTFDHVAFAEKVNGASQDNEDGYKVTDVWGDVWDVRDVDVVLTESMLKLWDSYSSLGDYLRNCHENHYTMSIPKVAPEKLDDVWTTNYQFLQSYDLTDDELRELVQPTMDWLDDIMGGDYRKLMLYVNGTTISTSSFLRQEPSVSKGMFIEPNLVHDTITATMIRDMTKKKVQQAKLGKILVNGNFEIACGDPYALWQSIFGLKVTGLLYSGEIYSKHWVDRDSRNVICFRAPMTCANNIVPMAVATSEDIDYWYQYIKTMVIFNAWDTAADAMNGED